MKTPFTIEQFFAVFENYNHTVFPAQPVLFLTGILILCLLHLKLKRKDVWMSCCLGLLWLWTGIVYHIFFFTEINKAAYGFGILFILQGWFFLWEGGIRNRLKFGFAGTTRGYTGYFFLIYGLILYPVIHYLAGHDLLHTISLGLPCPTVIFTFGLLLLTDRKFPKYLLVIPTIWALIGISTVINLEVYQDSVMVLAAVIGNLFLFKRKKTNGNN